MWIVFPMSLCPAFAHCHNGAPMDPCHCCELGPVPVGTHSCDRRWTSLRAPSLFVPRPRSKLQLSCQESWAWMSITPLSVVQPSTPPNSSTIFHQNSATIFRISAAMPCRAVARPRRSPRASRAGDTAGPPAAWCAPPRPCGSRPSTGDAWDGSWPRGGGNGWSRRSWRRNSRKGWSRRNNRWG